MQTPIVVNKTEIDGISIFSFLGSIDESNVDGVFRTVFDSFYGNKLIFDVSGLTYGNSRFMGYLSSMNQYVHEKNGIFYIANAVNPIRDYLESVGILMVVPAATSVDQAIREIKKGFSDGRIRTPDTIHQPMPIE